MISDYEVIDNITNYREFLQEETQTKFIKEKTRTGKPCGDKEFYDKVQLLTGVDYKKKKPGPRMKNQHDKG